MAAERNFEMFAAQYDEALRAGADQAMMALLERAATIMPAVLTPLVIGLGVLWAIGQLGLGRAFSYIARIAVVVWLIVSLAYIPMIRDTVVNDFPNEIAGWVNGDGQAMSSAAQFDRLDEANAHFTSLILGQATGFLQMPTRIIAHAHRAAAKFWLELIFYIWIACRMLTYLLVASGVVFVFFLLFESTRNWFGEFLGKLVGVCVWQLMSAIMLRITLVGMEVYMRAAIANPGRSLDEQLETAADIAGWFLGCFILLLLLPAAAGVGSGMVAGAAQGTVLGLMTTAARGAERMTAALDRYGDRVRGGGGGGGGGNRSTPNSNSPPKGGRR